MNFKLRIHPWGETLEKRQLLVQSATQKFHLCMDRDKLETQRIELSKLTVPTSQIPGIVTSQPCK